MAEKKSTEGKSAKRATAANIVDSKADVSTPSSASVPNKKQKRVSAKGASEIQEFRKANDSIGLRVQEGKFTLLSRKIYNVFITSAQQQGQLGSVAPPGMEGDRDYFWIRLRELVKSADFDSNNYDLLKETTQELQDIKVVKETDNTWTSERLLAGAKIHNTKGLKSQGGEVWIGFAFPPEVRNVVLNPATYTKFSLKFQTALRGNGSLGLYEITRRFATNPSHLTHRAPWALWYQSITGTPISETIPQYKYFKRDILKKAIAEINAVTDIKIELIEHMEGRKIVDLQFRVDFAEQAPLDLAAAPPIDFGVIERIIQFGLSKDEARDIYLQYDEKTVMDHVTLTEERISNTKLLAIDSPAAYFKTAIKAGYAKNVPVAKPSKTKSVKKETVKPGTPSVRERYEAARNEAAMALFAELPGGEQKDVFERYAKDADKSLRPHIKKQGIESALVKANFSQWFAHLTWGAVTDAQIIQFLDSGEVA
jgi:hypothetical protein